MSVSVCPHVPTLTKYAGTNTVFEADFTNYPEVLDGQVLTDDTLTATVSPAGPTIGTPVLGTGDNVGKVLFRISGGTAGDTEYIVTVTVSTDNSPTVLVMECPLKIC